MLWRKGTNGTTAKLYHHNNKPATITCNTSAKSSITLRKLGTSHPCISGQKTFSVAAMQSTLHNLSQSPGIPQPAAQKLKSQQQAIKGVLCTIHHPTSSFMSSYLHSYYIAPSHTQRIISNQRHV